VLFVDPINRVVEIRKKHFRLNFTDGFTAVTQGDILEQDLRDIAQ